MSTRQCARPSCSLLPYYLHHALRGLLTPVVSCILLLATFSLPSISIALESPSAPEYETIIVAATLNMEPKGDITVLMSKSGDFLVKESDLKSMGLRGISAEAFNIDGEGYLSLKSMREMTFVFDEKKLTLALLAAPGLLPQKTIDFLPPRQPNVYYPRDSAGFLNYNLNYFDSSPSGYHAFTMNDQVGIRTPDLLFLSDAVYTDDSVQRRFTRLMSSITYDRRNELQRLVVGDVVATSGALGSSVNLGGISFSKAYTIDPYFIKNPLLNFSGMVSLPSEADIYLNGMKIRTEKLPPGAFQLNNLQPYGGASLIEVVIRDPFGGEQRIGFPAYFTDILLKKGLQEYSYNIGFLREQFGTASNEYGDAAFALFHRYGLTDTVTIGGRAEGTGGLTNAGLAASVLLGHAGVLSAGLAGSSDSHDGKGTAGSLSYVYQSMRVNASFFVNTYSDGYRTIGTRDIANQTKSEVGAGLGYYEERLGSLFLDYLAIDRQGEPKAQTTKLTYKKNLSRNVVLIASLGRVTQQTTANEFVLGLTYYPGKDLSATMQYARTENGNAETVQFQKNQPIGEGFGYSATVSRADTGVETDYTINPSVQYNGRYNIFRGDFNERVGNGSGQSSNLSVSGAIVAAGNVVGFTRPVTDSFGLVKVGDIEGVRVYSSNQEIGRTNKSGIAFVPNLNSYYDNLVTIEDKDIPMEYTLSGVAQYVSPPLRSGSCLLFSARKLQYVTGRLFRESSAGAEPVEFAEVTLAADGKTIAFPTGRGGEFSFENTFEGGRSDQVNPGCTALAAARPSSELKPGTYPASFDYRGRTCTFGLTIPDSRDTIIDVGKVTCR